jgi:thioredoxin reductase (NADPH)
MGVEGDMTDEGDAAVTETATAGSDGADEADVREAIVIGSGPSGYTAAIYLARAGLRPLVLEGSVTAGGALMNTTDVENYPGFPDGVMGPELMDNLRKQAERFGAELVTDDATEVDLAGTVKVVKVGTTAYRSRTVVLAMGSAYKSLGIPGEDRLSGRGVSWCATCDGFFFRDQEIVVVGGGDSALEEATFLTRFAKKVTLVHRRDTLRASRIMQERARSNDKIEFVWDTEVLEAVGEDRLEHLRLRNLKTGEESTLPATGLFIAIGHDPRSELVRGQVELDDEGYVVVHALHSTATNLSGVFAAGDLVDHTYRQAITAAGTGCAAALDAERHLAATEGPVHTGAGWDTGVPADPPDEPFDRGHGDRPIA